jgi:serine/threonine-protein kinase
MEVGSGQYITAKLRRIRLLGQGGMGSVWEAEHLGLKTRVAVKLMSSGLTWDAALVMRFRNEAVAAARIKSPHIVQVFDEGVTPEGVPYIVMELLEGEDLGKRLKRAGPLPLPDVVAVVVQVARALAKAHAADIVHRDIKPANIFLTEQDGALLVKVLDFGVAKHRAALAAMTTCGAVMGTPLFMSPEQLRDAGSVDGQADLWSLAITAYYSLLGQVPFDAETVDGLRACIARGEFAPPSAYGKGTPPALDAWFSRAFAGSAASRFTSAEKMAAALEEAVFGSDRTLGPPKTRVFRGKRTLATTGALVGTAACVIMACAMAGGDAVGKVPEAAPSVARSFGGEERTPRPIMPPPEETHSSAANAEPARPQREAPNAPTARPGRPRTSPPKATGPGVAPPASQKEQGWYPKNWGL